MDLGQSVRGMVSKPEHVERQNSILMASVFPGDLLRGRELYNQPPPSCYRFIISFSFFLSTY